MEYKIGDKIVIKKYTLSALCLSRDKEYTIMDISNFNYCYKIINNIGDIVSVHEIYFTLSPSYERNKTIEYILT